MEFYPTLAEDQADLAWLREEATGLNNSVRGERGPALLSGIQKVNVVRPGGIGSHCILSQAEHSVEIIFETLRGRVGERVHSRPETLKE